MMINKIKPSIDKQEWKIHKNEVQDIRWSDEYWID